MLRITLIIFFLGFSAPASGAVLMSQEKALSLAFPGGGQLRQTIYLTDAERDALQKSARARVEGSVFTFYSGTLADGTPGRAFFETHVVRTMPETFMTVVDAEGAVRFVELLAFYEPADYKPPKRWMDQFRGKTLGEELLVKRGIRNITGSTLTAQALTDGVRRAAALSRLISEREAADNEQ